MSPKRKRRSRVKLVRAAARRIAVPTAKVIPKKKGNPSRKTTAGYLEETYKEEDD